MDLAEIESFFTAYAQAFSRLDGDAVAAHCALPMAISQGEAVTWWNEPEPVRDNMRKLCEVYRQAGMAKAEPLLESVQALGAADAFVRVRWMLTRVDGSLLQRFSTGYHLKQVTGEVKVLLVTAFDEDLQAMKETGR